MIRAENVGSFFESLNKWEQELDQLVEGVARGLAIRTFSYIVENSAQFTGDFAANWNLSVGQPDYSFVQNKFFALASGTLAPRIAGHPEAVNDAKTRAQAAIRSITLGTPIYITNTAGNEEPYAWKIEKGVIKFREGNQGHTVERAMDYIKANSVLTRSRTMDLFGAQL